MLMDSFADCYMINRPSFQDEEYWSFKSSVARMLLTLIAYGKVVFVQYFFVARAFQQTILYVFVFYQSQYRLEQL